MSSRSTLQSGWWVVVASFCSMFIGAGTMFYALGVLLVPVTDDLHISRRTFSTGILVASIAMAIACPLLGSALDRWGQRRVLLPMIACSAGAAASLSTLNGSLLQVVVLFTLWGALASAVSPVPFARAVSERFDARRGLALGIAICGAGFGAMLVPRLIGSIVQHYGWRTAFVGYGAAIAVLAWLPVALLMERKQERDLNPAPRVATEPSSEGLTLVQALRTREFWQLLIAALMGIVSINGTVGHLTALLVDRGMAIEQATVVLSAVGGGAIVGRLLSGWLLDRRQGPRIAALFFLLPALGVMLLARGDGGAQPFVAAFLLGLGVGGEVDVLAYFTGRFFGMKSFGRIYGLLFALFSVGGGLGPFFSGLAYELKRSYDVALVAYQVALVAASLLTWTLGAYRYAAHVRRVRTPGALSQGPASPEVANAS